MDKTTKTKIVSGRVGASLHKEVLKIIKGRKPKVSMSMAVEAAMMLFVKHYKK